MDYSDYIRFNADVIALPSGRRPNRDRGDYASDAKMGRPGRDPRGHPGGSLRPCPPPHLPKVSAGEGCALSAVVIDFHPYSAMSLYSVNDAGAYIWLRSARLT